jgi:hypothetical protein
LQTLFRGTRNRRAAGLDFRAKRGTARHFFGHRRPHQEGEEWSESNHHATISVLGHQSFKVTGHGKSVEDAVKAALAQSPEPEKPVFIKGKPLRLEIAHEGTMSRSEESALRDLFAQAVTQNGVRIHKPVVKIRQTGKGFAAAIHLRHENRPPNGEAKNGSPIGAFGDAMRAALRGEEKTHYGKKRRQASRNGAQAGREQQEASYEMEAAANELKARGHRRIDRRMVEHHLKTLAATNAS